MPDPLYLRALSAGLVLLGVLLLAPIGCSNSPEVHQSGIDRLRAQLPYKTVISYSHSMDPVFKPGHVYVVAPVPYDQVCGNSLAVFWPASSSLPVCHFVGSRIGYDSWSTHGIGQEDDTYRWILTRDNYIGVMQP